MNAITHNELTGISKRIVSTYILDLYSGAEKLSVVGETVPFDVPKLLVVQIHG